MCSRPHGNVDSSELELSLQGVRECTSTGRCSYRDSSRRKPPNFLLLGFHRDVAHNASVKTILKLTPDKRMCLRLDATDISTAALTSRDVFSLVDNYSLASENVIVLLDTQCVFGYAAPQICGAGYSMLSSLSARKWSAILVGGYGIPEQNFNGCFDESPRVHTAR